MQTVATSTKPFRADDWWTSKASLLMGFVYLFVLWFHIPFIQFVPLSVLSVVVIAGFASFGYLVNDFFDKEKDRLAGKRNFLLNKSASYQLGLFAFSLLLVSAPWIYLPKDDLSFALIGIELLLFIVYSAPVVRLKEKGIVGVAVDALYAHAIPTLLAAHTFALAASPQPLSFGEGLTGLVQNLILIECAILILFLWQFLCGVRNILIHQQEDRSSDKQSQTRTFISMVSVETGVKIIRYILLAELVSCIIFFSVFIFMGYGFAICLAVVLVLSIPSAIRYMRGETLPDPPLRYFPNNVYEKCLPVLYLLILSYFDRYFLIVLLLHICLFNIRFLEQSLRVFKSTVSAIPIGSVKYKVLIPVRIFISKVVNHGIYYTLLLFRIDLKKEQLSAAEYFKKKKGTNK